MFSAYRRYWDNVNTCMTDHTLYLPTNILISEIIMILCFFNEVLKIVALSPLEMNSFCKN